MSRKDDLEQAIEASSDLIREYQDILRESESPKAKARARREIAEQRELIEEYQAELDALMGNVKPDAVVRNGAHAYAREEGQAQGVSSYVTKTRPSRGGRGKSVLRDILVGIVVTLIGGIILAWIIRDARFDPTRKASVATVASTSPSTPVPKAGATRIREKDGAVMVYVPAGQFRMGSSETDIDAILDECPDCSREQFAHEEPQGEVSLDAFWIDRTEVTNAQYQECVAAQACTSPTRTASRARENYYGSPAYDAYPVIYVKWNQAFQYAEWAEARLCTEAQWEYACRGHSQNVYPWESDSSNSESSYYDVNLGDTARVDQYSGETSWCGAWDMAGNVWEWTSSVYRDYLYDADDGRENLSASGQRVLRGRAFYDEPVHARCAARNMADQDQSHDGFGFRLCDPIQ